MRTGSEPETRHEFWNFLTEVTRGRRGIAILCAHRKARRDHRMMSLAGPNPLGRS
jgi:hypothetical protein